MDFLKSTTGKIIGGAVTLAVILAAISWWRTDPATRSMLISGTGRIISWLGIVLIVPWATFFIIGRVGKLDSNAAGAMLVASYTLLEAVLLLWLFKWKLPNATAWTFLAVGALFAAVYNLFTCDFIAEKVEWLFEVRKMATPNQRISEYILDARIGGGSFGEVWRAHHHVWIDQLVAIKIPTDAQFVRALQREGVAIHGLTHPNIVRAIGFDPYADPPYLTMEYIPGTSLRPMISKKSLAINDVVAIMRQMLAGLSHAHERGLVHRDIKPENILVHERASTEGYNSEGAIKVTDFGLGKAASTAAVGSIAYSMSTDDPRAKEIAGTLDYMAPEQRAGGDVDARADIYACGVVLYELLTGERPAGTELPSDLNKSVPKHLDEAFKHSYARLEKRYASAKEFIDALGRPTIAHPASIYGAPRAGTMQPCPQCHRMIDATDQFCMHCGVQLVPAVRRCQRCGAYPDLSDRFCIFCGESLESKELTTA